MHLSVYTPASLLEGKERRGTGVSEASANTSDHNNTYSEEDGGGVVKAVTRTNLLKQTIQIEKKPKLNVRFLRDPSPRRTESKKMLAKERLIDANANLLPTLGNTNLDVESNQRLQLKEKERQRILQKKNEILPPTYFAAYVVPKAMSPFCKEYQERARRVVGHVDTGASPWSVVSETFVKENNLLTSEFKTSLGLGDKEAAPVQSSRITDLNLRVTIGDRARILHLKAVVWKDEQCTCPLLISREDALRTGLIIFVHDNDIREALLGIAPLKFDEEFDPVQTVGKVATIISVEEDELLHERISPLEGLRIACSPSAPSSDPWVQEFMRPDSEVKEVFGPIPREPAKVPYLDFEVDEDAVAKRTYGNTQPIRIAMAAPRKQDSIDAHVAELQGYNAIEMAYPNITPQAIASVAFCVPKPGVQFLARPDDFVARIKHPLQVPLSQLHKAYLESLTMDRLVVNFKPVNEVSRVQHYPVPTVQENLQKLSRFKFFSKIDITKAFWGVGVSKRCQKWLYTIAPGGHAWVWTRAPMGHSAVPGHFQFCMNGMLLSHEAYAFSFADDILVGANSEEELKERIRAVLATIMQTGFRVNAKKCQFFPQKEITYLGWVVGDGQLKPTNDIIEKLWLVKRPCDLSKASDKEKRKLVKRFLGVCLYLGAYLPHASERLRSLHQITSVKKTFKWTKEAADAWDWAVECIRTIQPLYFPTYTEGSWLETLGDASKYGWGGILVEFRKDDPKPYLVMCVAGTFTPSQLNWPTIQKECLANWLTVRKCKCYLDGHEFVLNMDHKNLLWSSMSSNEVVRRLATDLQQFKFIMRHIDGSKNVLADYLSRAEHITQEEFTRLRTSETQRQRSPSPATRPRDRRRLSEQDETSMPESTTDENFTTDSEFSLGIVRPVVDNSHVPQGSPIAVGQSLDNPQAQVQLPNQGRSPRRRAAPRNQRQVPSAFREGEDDGQAIPFLEPIPNPPKRFLAPEVYHLLHKFHGGVCPHTGVRPLIQALQEAGHQWPTMEEDCKSFVARCHLCQLERLNRRGPRCLPYRSILIPSNLFEVWTFDIIGPLQKCDLTGAQYIYVGYEEVSHLIVLDHSPEASTPELMFMMLNTFKFFGLPSIIKSDVGPQFISKTISDFCQASGIEHRFGIPYNHRSDGTIENGIRTVWSYLRLAIHDLKRYAAWAPLLMNVMLGCNSLPREVLGGAWAWALIFNRKVQPMRFLRPDTLRAPYNTEDPGREDAQVQVNGFIADQAAQQLRLLYFAEQTRQERYGENVQEAERQLRQQEEEQQGQNLDWVRVGQLVSIPQEEHDRQLRPTKMSLRRTGPYEVMECATTTVKLRDRRMFMARENPVTFLWPKRELWPYFTRCEPAENFDELRDDQPDELPHFVSTQLVNAVLEHRFREHSATPRNNVRNFDYLVRWEGQPHSQTTWERYENISHMSAFQDFVRDSGLTNHVPTTQHSALHRQHVTQLLRGEANPVSTIPIQDPRQVVQNLQGYFSSDQPLYPNRAALQRSINQSEQSQTSASSQNARQ